MRSTKLNFGHSERKQDAHSARQWPRLPYRFRGLSRGHEHVTNTIGHMLASVICLTSCNSTVKLQGDKQEPIHIVMDINIRLDKESDAFFDFEDEIDAEVESVSPQSKSVGLLPPAEQLERSVVKIPRISH